MEDYVQHYREFGYAIIRKVLGQQDIEKLSASCDALLKQSEQYERSFRHKNQLFLIQNDAEKGKVLRFMAWPSYTNNVFERYRTDSRLLQIVKPLIGDTLKQVSNQVIWKPPETQSTSYGFHQDARFRRPASAFRNIGNSYIQTAIAIDEHRPENGCLKIVSGSHRAGYINRDFKESVFDQDCTEEVLLEWGLGGHAIVNIDLEPGDVAIWHPFAVHGSGPNLSTENRRSFLNGYVKADCSDRGEWAFRASKAVPLGDEPMLVQYEDLYTRPEPHYITGPPNPFLSASQPEGKIGET